ncbi:hypothetical protein G7Y79_00001g004190 [Physcia stellaris]|nr:hypothetical protein G7Y79_00001g004190 [Physcia stellaris]
MISQGYRKPTDMHRWKHGGVQVWLEAKEFGPHVTWYKVVQMLQSMAKFGEPEGFWYQMTYVLEEGIGVHGLIVRITLCEERSSAVANTALFGHRVGGLVGVIVPSTEPAKSDVLFQRAYGESVLHDCTISRTKDDPSLITDYDPSTDHGCPKANSPPRVPRSITDLNTRHDAQAAVFGAVPDLSDKRRSNVGQEQDMISYVKGVGCQSDAALRQPRLLGSNPQYPMTSCGVMVPTMHGHQYTQYDKTFSRVWHRACEDDMKTASASDFIQTRPLSIDGGMLASPRLATPTHPTTTLPTTDIPPNRIRTDPPSLSPKTLFLNAFSASTEHHRQHIFIACLDAVTEERAFITRPCI